jgi:tRNA nucleotidyltransferase (CCA-adding enzyme)
MITELLGKNSEVHTVFGLLLYEDRVAIIGRARSDPQIHVGNICKLFGGGGHPAAASATVKGITLPEVTY